jgi:hypothetical protein
MKKRTRYVFGAALAGTALAGVPGILNRACAALITNADFTFEVSGTALNATNVTSPVIGPLPAEVGTGSAYGSHAATNTVYSSPAGNGSARSLSSNNWAVGDYYQFNVPTTNIQNIVFSFDQTSSNTGPKDWVLYVSTDGTNFSTVQSYSVLANAASTVGTVSVSAWGAPPSQGIFNNSFNLSGLTALNNDPLAEFRIAVLDTVPANTTGPFASGGTDRIDNVVVAGTAVPEPASLTLLTVATAALMYRRRSRNENADAPQ